MENDLEIEIKSKVENLEDLEKKIVLLGAVFLGTEFQNDWYFKHPCRDFSITDEALRVRDVNGKLFLTYKGKRIDNETKTRKEIEITVDSNIFKILEYLGFEIFMNIKKVRKNYGLDNVKISLDYVENLGNFIEMEVHGNYEEGKLKLFSLAEKLSLKKIERRSYLEMLVNSYEKF
ncbi:MAG: class IV adenylate cyclase [Thermoplasmata archaeon]